jgi:hypothetical protein
MPLNEDSVKVYVKLYKEIILPSFLFLVGSGCFIYVLTDAVHAETFFDGGKFILIELVIGRGTYSLIWGNLGRKKAKK